jgi:hypothetical protein
MQISLQEDDSLFHGGTPQLVVLVVKFDNGNTRRIPYEACKTIASLYQDLYAIAPQIAEAPQQTVEEVIDGMEGFAKAKAIAAVAAHEEIIKQVYSKPVVDKSNTIEKEDIVTLIKLNPREFQSGTVSPLIVGMDYRVLKVIGPTIPTPDGKGIKKIIQGFEVIDDSAPTPERMVVTPDEVQLKSKRLSQVIKKTQAVEEMLPCPDCRTLNALTLVGTDFKGTCEACGKDIDKGRVIKKCSSVGCGQEVSCFDVGGKYEGMCGKCKAKIEVAYA